MIKSIPIEKKDQYEFYEVFLPRIAPELDTKDFINNNTDGVINGNILEFKTSIKVVDSLLFQCIKYLSHFRIIGKPVPKNILLIDTTKKKTYVYNSEKYLTDIEKVYNVSASKENNNFIGGEPEKILSYNKDNEAEELIKILKQNLYTKINIDENCIVGWANYFYKLCPNARKEDFLGDNTGKHKVIGEIREPNILIDYIYAYKGKTNVKFQYLMDKLNDDLLKKDLGAFYTPKLYAEKSIELLRKAIKKVPKGNDYIILDRCAGTGNLELYLNDEELSHCVLSTIEYYEYKVLLELLGNKVRHIIPPIEQENTFKMGLVNGADALSEEYVNNSIIKQYIDNNKCSIILFENPPYAEITSIEHQKTDKKTEQGQWKKSFVFNEMKKEIKGSALNDLGNVFIWSAFHYYLRQKTDFYIVYSPIKYWKAQNLIDKKFVDGFAFNRRHFHTNIDACVSCILWQNENGKENEFELKGFDIENEKLSKPIQLKIQKINSLFSQKYYEKPDFKNATYDGIIVDLQGNEVKNDKKIRIKPLYDKNMLGYLVADSVGFDNPDAKSSLLVAGRYNGNGFYLKKDSFLDKLPLFVSSRYITYNREWTERARIMKSGDGAEQYYKDLKKGKLDTFLYKCLIFTCFEMQNHMRTFIGSDKRLYKNELCLDTTNGDTIASKILKQYKDKSDLENELFKEWKSLYKEIVKTKEYNKKLTYGIYQIFSEINTFTITDSGERIPNNELVNSRLISIKRLVKEYYNKELVKTLFKYEFLK